MFKIIIVILGTIFLLFFINYFMFIGLTYIGLPIWLSTIISLVNTINLSSYIIYWLSIDS